MSTNSRAFVRWEAQRLAAMGDHAGALELVGLIKAPDTATEILRGRILAQCGQFAAAAEAFRAALAGEPENAGARQGLALADRLTASRIGRLRLHARRWIAVSSSVVLIAAIVAFWPRDSGSHNLTQSISMLDSRLAASHAAQQTGNRELAEHISKLTQTISVFDSKLAASHAAQQAGSRELAERVSELEQALQHQADASGQSSKQLLDELRRLQKRMAGTATGEQMKAVKIELMNMLRRMESATASSEKR